MRDNPIFQPALDTTASQQTPFVPRPDADFYSDELEKSFRGFLNGALDANEQVKASTANLAAFGYPTDISGNADVLHVALRRWRTDLVASIQKEQAPQSIRDTNMKGLLEGTGLSRTLPSNPTPSEPASIVDRIITAEMDRDLRTQKAILEDFISTVNFDRLATNINTLQRQTNQQAPEIDMAADQDDEPGISPR